MPSLPIPVFGALVLMFLCLRIHLRSGRTAPLAILLGLCAAQALVIALAQHYLVPGMRFVQPVTATLIPPAAWLAYQTTAVRDPEKGDLLHIAGPVAAILCLALRPAFLDLLIPALFTGYGFAILVAASRSADAPPRLALESGNLPGRIWLLIGATLVASALSDALILLAHAFGAAYLQPWIVSLYVVGNLVLIGALVLSGQLEPGDETETASETTTPPPPPPDAELWSRVERYMAEARPYLDPELTLARLARKLTVPAKTLSETINRATGQNVSRYVNNARIHDAQSALLAGESVTSAMLSSGFNTKSNFHREFLRVAGKSPSAWLAETQGTPADR